MKFTLIGLGEVIWDIFSWGKRLGGAPANFAYHAHALGGEGVVVSCIGNDNQGKEILNFLDHHSLNRNYIAVDHEHPTGIAIQKSTIVIPENVAFDFIPQTIQLRELAKEADAICFGSLAQRSEVSRATIQAFLKEVSTKALRIFDINLRRPFYSREIVETSLQLANVLKINNDEAKELAKLLSLVDKEKDIDEETLLAELARHYSLHLIALTKGENGSTLYNSDSKRFYHHYGYKVEQADPEADSAGAGDSFTAALALGLLKGRDLEYINDCANRVASFVCSKKGATPELPLELVTGF